ncbi:MAG TPA: hypothetical protein VGH33_03465 [Isosphaeraceae bacterium]
MPPVSFAFVAPSPNVPSASRPVFSSSAHFEYSGEVAPIASSPAAAIRFSSNDLAFFAKKSIAGCVHGFGSIFKAPIAISPEAVVPQSGFPPGAEANPPYSLS